MPTPKRIDKETGALISHLLGLRKDLVQDLLRGRIRYAGLNMAELRDQVVAAIRQGSLTPSEIAQYLDEVEPNGKQHVFLLRSSSNASRSWRDLPEARRRLRRKAITKELIDATPQVLMPKELTVSRIQITDEELTVWAVHARKYFERDKRLDQSSRTPLGETVELRAHVERVARNIVLFRWRPATRHASLQITQATSRGVGADHHHLIRDEFFEKISGWLDDGGFRPYKLHRAMEQIRLREQTPAPLTRSRRARWGTLSGAELEATSAGAGSSVYADQGITTAVGQVATASSGQGGSLFWLPDGASPVQDDLHIRVMAAEGRIQFLRPSDEGAVLYVVNAFRRL